MAGIIAAIAGTALSAAASGAAGAISGAASSAAEGAQTRQTQNLDYANQKKFLDYKMSVLEKDGLPRSSLLLSAPREPMYLGNGNFRGIRSNATTSAPSNLSQMMGYYNYAKAEPEKKSTRSIAVSARPSTRDIASTAMPRTRDASSTVAPTSRSIASTARPQLRTVGTNFKSLRV